MDYKKEYKDAMERAKKWALTHKLCIEDIFPELAESEDERIRKKIIENVRLSGGYTDEEIDEMISWLEKQKEPRYAIRATKGFGDPDGPQFELVDLQEEQKPAEWNTNDKAFIKDCARILDENGYTASAERLLSMFLIKPAECIEDSVEFEEGFKAGRESGLRDGQNYVLDNLDSYGLCKLAEWSEEDENARQNLIAHFEGKVLRLSDEAKKEAVDWLKSLRPQSHWKPSEEQIKAIRLAKSFVVDDFDEHPTLSEILMELEEQLKKLI